MCPNRAFNAHDAMPFPATMAQVAEGSGGVSEEAKAVELRFLVGLSEVIPSEKSPAR